MSSFELNYRLTGTGWAEVTFEHASSEPIDASYLHDSLLDLSEMALNLSEGAEEAQALFMDEPGEHFLVVNRSGDKAHYELRCYKDWCSWGLASEKEFQVVLAGESTVQVIVSEIVKVLDLLYSKHGEIGYREKWAEHGFPITNYRALTNE